MSRYEWLLYVAVAGLAWGTYVPIIFYGGNELSARPGPSGRFMAILCVGGAYFVIGVLFPVLMFVTGALGVKWDDVNRSLSGVVFASLAGVAGAVGAIGVIFATTSAMAAAREAGLPPATYRVYIAPLIFGLAPVINVLVSMVWHPQKGDPWHFGLKHVPGLLWVGILLVAAGAALVLYSKEIAEAAEQKGPPLPASQVPEPPPSAAKPTP
ncbi:MAG: hypothetical protein NZ700_09120 [Gemmataceae bacterium]|nr:hypothetical protein [Gemmataceae bacterium]MDW8264876.1 hypothetical protein [Gemmataceae bacterium]